MKMTPNFLILIAAMMFLIGDTFTQNANADQDAPVKTSKPSVIDPKTYLREPEVDAEVIRKSDDTFTLRWKADAQAVSIFTGESQKQIDHGHPIARIRGAHEANIHIAKPTTSTTRRYFELKFTGGAMNGKSCIVAERFLPMKGTANFRDVGGYRTEDGHHVRWGVVYRSEGLSHLTESDTSYLAEVLQLHTLFDFRDATEIKSQPDHLPAQSQIQTVNLPIGASGMMGQLMAPIMKGDDKALQEVMAQSYINMVETHGTDVFGPFIAQLADTKNQPVIYHCTAGKDRTGIATALFLSLLGVPEKTVVADYSLSNRAFDSLMVALKGNSSLTAAGITPDKMAPLIIANPLWMERTLEHIRTKYGSVENYLKTAGKLDDATLAKIRANFVE